LRDQLLFFGLAELIHKIADKLNQNKAGWGIQADFFADSPNGLFLRDQEAKTSESGEMPG